MKKFYKPRNIVPEIEEISFEDGKINAQLLMSILGFFSELVNSKRSLQRTAKNILLF